MKVCIHVQHLLGSGHLVRMRRLAHSLQIAGHRVCLLSGGLLKGDTIFETVQLPVVKTRPGNFTTLLDHSGVAVDDAWKQRRLTILLDHLDRLRPDVLVVETWPFGRRQLEFEILPMLDHVRGWKKPPSVVTSIRDVLQERKLSRRMETLERLRQYVAMVLVHGDSRLVDLSASFPEAARVPCPVHYSGYISEDTGHHPDSFENSGEILVSAGGGATGDRLLETAVESASVDSGMQWRVLLGQRVPNVLAKQLKSRQRPNLVVEENRSDFSEMLAGCRVSVSQFGYNTATDLLRAGCPAVVVPYAADGETEQATRARRFASLGRVIDLPETRLSPKALTDAVQLASERPMISIEADLDGARGSVLLLEQLYSKTRT